jgi:hypothetical protein
LRGLLVKQTNPVEPLGPTGFELIAESANYADYFVIAMRCAWVPA